MIHLLKVRSLYIFVLLIIPLAATDTYRIMQLPSDFYISSSGVNRSVLNNLGQIAGTFSPNTKTATEEAHERRKKSPSDPNFDPYEGAKAAYWDSVKGMIVTTMPAYKSLGCSINDNGLVGIAIYPEKKPYNQQESRSVVWNTKTNEVKLGPLGYPEAINNEGLVWVRTSQHSPPLIWDSIENTHKYITGSNQGFVKAEHFLGSDKNNNGIMVSRSSSVRGHGSGPDIELKLDGNKHKLLLPCSGRVKERAHLNNNNVIIALSVVKDAASGDVSERDCNNCVINKWKMDGSVSCSEELQKMPEFKDYTCFHIVEFNDAGQILIGASKPPSYINKFLGESSSFLLTPLDK